MITVGSNRVPIWKRAARKLFRLSSLIADRATCRFIRHNLSVWRGWASKRGDGVILVDLHEIGETLISYSYFLNVLARKHAAAIKSFGSWQGNRVVRRVYRSFNTVGHIIPGHLTLEQERLKEAISRDLRPTLRTKQDVFGLEVLGVVIGIDIYESYLREYKPTVFLDDPRLFELVDEGIMLVIFWQAYFRTHRVAAVVVSHDCYLQPDVVCKVAYQAGVPVYLPNIRGIVYAQRPRTVYACVENYRHMFSRLPLDEQRHGIALAKRQLERRFEGEIGVDMPHATKSAFVSTGDEKRVLKESDRIKVLICSHCFYDNPHGLGDMLFLDFYDWLRYLGSIAERTNYDWYLKVHPDPLPGTLETIREILAEFPKITLIPHTTSHLQLAREGIDFALTVYGSVGHEYPALGVQVINAAYNLRVAYDFNWHPKSREEYEYYLLNLDKLHKEIRLEELYEFYYMYHFYTYADDLVLESYRQFVADLTAEQRSGSAAYEYFLGRLTEGKHQAIIAAMGAFIESGKPYYFSRGPE